jgi:hypothetical protein
VEGAVCTGWGSYSDVISLRKLGSEAIFALVDNKESFEFLCKIN